MIINIPSANDLNDVALRLYFSAWDSLMTILWDFDQAFGTNEDENYEEGVWGEERSEYLRACQPELQSICTLIQQSNELALKAKVCDVSPYLLLLGNDAKFSTTPKDFDFAEFRTLDAVELPAAVNSLCKDPLSDHFIQTFNLIRSLRNKIAHLGLSGKVFHPHELLHILVSQYSELWKGRLWLHDRVDFASQTRSSFFYDYKYTSPHMHVMHEMPYTLSRTRRRRIRATGLDHLGLQRSNRQTAQSPKSLRRIMRYQPPAIELRAFHHC
jgi:hypothetical protein